MPAASLLLLADGRFPSGGHAHSGGVEAACASGAISDLWSLETFIRARLSTAGLVDATFGAASNSGLRPWVSLNDAYSIRVASPRLREVSITLGRQLLRAGLRVWPSARLDEMASPGVPSVHQPIVLGALAAAADLDPAAAAMCSLHHAATAMATAAVRLLGVDPFGAHRVLANLGPEMDRLAESATAFVEQPLRHYPAYGGPLVDILAEDHTTWEVRLFAS